MAEPTDAEATNALGKALSSHGTKGMIDPIIVRACDSGLKPKASNAEAYIQY